MKIRPLSDLERSVNSNSYIELKEQIIREFIDKRGITLCQESLGNMGYSCFVAKEASGEIISSGFGKGTDWEIGSFGECIEHLHLSDVANNPEQYEVIIESSELLQHDIFSQVGKSLNKQGNPIKAIPHQVFSAEETVYVPSAMFGLRRFKDDTALQDHELFYSRYSSSNGTAFGFSTNDALLHALLEVIERHEISKVFLSIIEEEPFNQGFVLVEEYLFNPSIAAIAEKVLHMGALQPVQSLIIKNEFGVYFSFSFTRGTRQGKNCLIWGAGCSLFRDLSLYRSVAECEQSLQVDYPREDDKLTQLAEIYPSFYKLCNFGTVPISVPKKTFSAELPENLTIERQLELVNNEIVASGRTALFYKHKALCNLYSVVSVYITNTEKFFGIIFGNPVLPIAHLAKCIGTSRLAD